MRVGYDLYRMLRAGMPATWTQGERLVALIIADNVSDRTRTGYIPNEQICEETGYTPKSLSDVLLRLSRHGYEMRIPHGTGKDGRPVYASRGHGTDYTVPILTPRTKARPSPGLSVDNPESKPRSTPGLTLERPGPDRQRPGPDGESPGPDRTPTPNYLTNPNKQSVAVITPPVEDGRLSTDQDHHHRHSNGRQLPIERAALAAIHQEH